MKSITYNGVTFTKDYRTGYYLSTRKIGDRRKRLHVFVWETENNTEVPAGFEIHHKDKDKDNNSISNLVLLTSQEHRQIHANSISDETLLKLKDNIKKAQESAKVWHGSEDGKEWHKKHWENVKDKMFEKVDLVCKHCGKHFTSYKRSKFCSNACKSAYRRENGLDDIELTCVICGKKFKRNKYGKHPKTCCAKCKGLYRKALNRVRED